MKLRKGVRILLWTAGSLAVAVAALYLLRWPLFGGVVRSKVADLVATELRSEVDFGRLGGSLLTGVRAKNAALRPRPGAPFRSATIETIEVDYGLFGSGEPSITVEGARFVLAPKEGPAPPLHQTIRDVVSVLRSLRFPGAVTARKVDLVLPDGRSVQLDRGMLHHGTWTVALRTQGFGTIEGTATLSPDGALVFQGTASEGPIRSAKLDLGPGGDRCALKIATELEGQPLQWSGTAFFQQGQLARVEGELSVKEGRAVTRADLITGRVEADVDGVIAVDKDFKGDLAITARGEGPMVGAKEDWTIREARVRTSGARYKDYRIDEADVTLGEGTLSQISFKGHARSGADRVQAEGFFKWTDKPDIDAAVEATIADVAPYLPLLKQPAPPLQLTNLRPAGKFLLRDGVPSFDGQVTIGAGAYEDLHWKEAVFKGSLREDKVEAREIAVTGTAFADAVAATGTYDAGTVLLKFSADKDAGEISGQLDRKSRDFEGKLKVEGPMAWLQKRFGLSLPENIVPIRAEGKIRRRKDDGIVSLDVVGKTGFSMALSATIRHEADVWIVAVAPGTVALPERSVAYEAFIFSLARGKASLQNVKWTCTQPDLAARMAGSAEWNDKETRLNFRMVDTKVGGQPIDPLLARVTIDHASGEIVPNLRWGREDGDHFHITGRWGKEFDLTVKLRAGDLKRPLVKNFVPMELEGAIAIDARLTGTPKEPEVTGTLNLMKISTAGLPPLSLEIPLKTSRNAVRIRGAAEKTPYGSLTIEGMVPLPGNDAPLDLSLRINTDDLSPLLDRMTPQARKWIPRGGLAAELSLHGPPLKPEFTGRAQFNAVRWTPPPPLAEAVDLRVVARLDADGVQIEIADGLLGQGPFWASGRWDFNRPNTPLSLWITAADALAVQDPLARLRVKPDVMLVWEKGRVLKLSGRVEIPLAIYHREFGAATPGARAAREIAAPRLRLVPGETGGFIIPGIVGLEELELDLSFVTTGEFRIENSAIGVLLAAQGHLTGTAAEPAISGSVKSLHSRGEVKLAPGHFLRIESLEVVFPDEVGRIPTVRFQGRVGAGEGAIQVMVDGPLESPSLVLRSDPPLPQKDLLAKLAFGHVQGAVSGEAGVAALAIYVFEQAQAADAWPSADRKEGFLDRFRPTVVASDTSLQRRVPWELPPAGTLRSTSLRTEYVYNSYFSIVAETNREGDVGGDLKLRIRF